MSPQGTDAYCNSIRPTVGIPLGFVFKFRHKRTLSRTFADILLPTKSPPQSMRPINLHLAYHSTPAGHPGELRMYEKIRRKYYLPNILTDVYSTI